MNGRAQYGMVWLCVGDKGSTLHELQSIVLRKRQEGSQIQGTAKYIIVNYIIIIKKHVRE